MSGAVKEGRIYLNLTSGLEVADHFNGFRLVRIQSSQLETFALWPVIAHLDYGFLIDAATCGVVLVDCGSRRSAVSRAQWQGIPWICYAYQRAIGNEPALTPYRNEFGRVYQRGHAFRDLALNKLRYVHKLTGSNGLTIEFRSFPATLDGNYPALARKLAEAA